jgi:outer membrane protein assembly factor BamA
MTIGKFLISISIVITSANLAFSIPPDTGSTEVALHLYSASIFPIAMYDSDIGVGLGVKAVLVKKIKRRSFDVTIFGSTKGEQWYAFVFSQPYFEARQGKRFPLAFDIKIEYDKLVKSNFFGIGNNTHDNNFQFPREYYKIEPSLSHAFTQHLAASLNLRIDHYSVYQYDLSWKTMSRDIFGAEANDIFAPGVGVRFDTRDSWINPHDGVKAELILEQSAKIIGFDWRFKRARLELNSYHQLFGSDDIIAARFWTQEISGNAPYQELSKIGDGWTARGFKADRFLDKAMALTSIEYRFPIFKKLGGVAFADAGRVWSSLRNFGFQQWHADWGGGLRYYLANFVARLDIGNSVEGTRIFFNFGQVF